MITANSFMKREFGKKLIEEFFPRIDLTHVVDTPGLHPRSRHTHSDPVRSQSQARTAIPCGRCSASRGSRARQKIPLRGSCGSRSFSQIDQAGAQDEFTSTADVPRTTFAQSSVEHRRRWSGGPEGADRGQLRSRLWRIDRLHRLHMHYTCEDDVFVSAERVSCDEDRTRWALSHWLSGDVIRDWASSNPSAALFPYDDESDASIEESRVARVPISLAVSNEPLRTARCSVASTKSSWADVGTSMASVHRRPSSALRSPSPSPSSPRTTTSCSTEVARCSSSQPRSSSCPPTPPRTTTSPCSVCSTVPRRASG